MQLRMPYQLDSCILNAKTNKILSHEERKKLIKCLKLKYATKTDFDKEKPNI